MTQPKKRISKPIKKISGRGPATYSDVLVASNLSKSFKQGGNVIQVLGAAEFALAEGEIVALVGPSGCGKTTFLHIVGLLDSPDQGSIRIKGIEYATASDGTRTNCRRHTLGFVYQSHNLLNDFTALGNVVLPLKLSGMETKAAEARAAELLERLNLADRLHHYPSQLSGGEQQRVAIARSLVHDPAIILADEPTGNLDSANAEATLELLIAATRSQNKALIIVTHNPAVAQRADRVMTIKNGKLVKAR